MRFIHFVPGDRPEPDERERIAAPDYLGVICDAAQLERGVLEMQQKWALQSRRFWGLLTTTVGSVLPFVGPLMGVEIDPVAWGKFSAGGLDAIDKVWTAVDAVMIVGGQAVAWWGAWNAKKPLKLYGG